MSGGSGTNSSWTILTPEETVAETLKPLAEGTERQEDDAASTAGSVPKSQSAEGLPAEDHPASDKNKEALSEDSGTDHHTYVPSSVTDVPIPSSSEASSDALGQSEAGADSAAEPGAQADPFSDSYSRLTPPPNELEPSPLSAETLGAADLPHQEESSRLLNGEELQQEGDESDLSPRTPDLGKQADSHEDSEVAEGKTEEEADVELEGQRKRSLLAALERVGRAEEDEEAEEEFQLPRREDDSGFSVNKCILGAVILLGLGTIFFSGVFMDLDEEGDYNTRELKDSEVPGKQEWLNPEVPPPPVDAASSELLNELAKGNQQISELQAQLQAQGEELKVAKGQAAEGAAERLRWEEENSRLKKEVASLPVLQKENQRMKRELESVPALQKELDSLRSTVTELKHSAAGEAARASASPAAPPSGGQAEDGRQGAGGPAEGDAGGEREVRAAQKVKERKDGRDEGDRKQRDEGKKPERKGEKKERKDGGKEKEWKKGTQEHGKFDKVKESKEGDRKQWKEKEKTRGDDGKLWKERDGKKEWKEKNERKDWKEERERRTPKHEGPGEGKQWKGKDESERKKGKGHGEGRKDEWKGERKVKDGFKESGREKWEKKEWSEKRGERKEWRGEGEWKGKEHGKEGKGRGERKEWEDGGKRGKGKNAKRQHGDWKGQSGEKEWKGKDEGKEEGWKRKDETKEWGKEGDWNRKDERKEWGKEEGWNRKDNRKEWGKGGDSNRKDNRKEWGKEGDSNRKEEGWKRKDEKKEWGNEGDRKRKDERKESGKEEDWKRKEKMQKGEWKKEAPGFHKHKDHKPTEDHREEHLWGESKPAHSHRKPTPAQPEYWAQQRARLQNNPKPAHACQSPDTCARSQGLLPVPRAQFETLLHSYLARAEQAGVDAPTREALAGLAAEFFPEGVFAHDRMSFRDFVEDLSDILEDMVDADEDGEDSALEDEMEEFGREAVEAFAAPGPGEKETAGGERRRERG